VARSFRLVHLLDSPCLSLNAQQGIRFSGASSADQLATALFANRAFLVEGPTESAVFYGIGDRTSPGALEAAGISIVSVGSKTSIPLAHAILQSKCFA
ncbi:TOPRIM nucleotidyl transferase/hydrolase domain-containing protein, partial [Burkholderia vietnamiensis]|uniref:TOPRIM nucleotidyl transferase/hydrolase domain-containing protein n=1 Tax=Burkholderia vietnamiensis TaxID=60552 RepID=UPI003132DD23